MLIWYFSSGPFLLDLVVMVVGMVDERVVEGMGELVVLIMVDSEEFELESLDFWSREAVMLVFLFLEVVAFLRVFSEFAFRESCKSWDLWTSWAASSRFGSSRGVVFTDNFISNIVFKLGTSDMRRLIALQCFLI